MLNHSCFRLRADANEGSQSNGGSRIRFFISNLLEHLGEYAARWRRTFMLRFTLTIHEHVLTFPSSTGPGGEVRQNATRGARKSRFSSASASLSPPAKRSLVFFGSITLFRRLLHGIGALAHLSLQLNRTSRVANCTLSSSEKTSRSSWQDCRCSSLTVFDTASPAGVSEMRFARRPRGAGRHSARPSASTKASMASVAVQRGCPKPKEDPVSREKCLSALLVGHCWKDGK